MDDDQNKSGAAAQAAAGVGLIGLMAAPVALGFGATVLLVLGGTSFLLMPLIILILIFGGGGSAEDQERTGTQAINIAQGDGQGQLDSSRVPADMYETLTDAGGKCTESSPLIIATQIHVQSDWDVQKGNGTERQGLTQLPQNVFDQYAEDADENDRKSPLDAKDSIIAQGKYFCAKAEEVRALLDGGQVEGNSLDLTLAAAYGGVDAIRAARGLPPDPGTQEYVLTVRANFAQFQGIGAPPTSFPSSPAKETREGRTSGGGPKS